MTCRRRRSALPTGCSRRVCNEQVWSAQSFVNAIVINTRWPHEASRTDGGIVIKEFISAIDDDEFGPRIRETRVYPPEERTGEARLARLRDFMAREGLLDDTSEPGRRNIKRLAQIPDNGQLLLDLETELYPEVERVRNATWLATGDYRIHDEAVQI